MKDYENINILGKNVLKPRSYFFAKDTNKNLKGYINLNGIWDFEYENKKTKIQVPSCWQLHGFDKPWYT
uniref:hypothetical protein n=1 Tax=Oceanivirga salmonicida TaxID=1769291 RepID=UPI0012E1F6A5